jgi:hypothetical protein
MVPAPLLRYHQYNGNGDKKQEKTGQPSVDFDFSSCYDDFILQKKEF